MRHLCFLLVVTWSATLLAADKPNILFIASDDMRPQLGCYGDPTVKSPNLDRLAARGMVFNRAFCQQALCSPSRISLLSGRYTATTKIWDIGPTLRSTMPDIVTLPQHFKNNGYHTQAFGKIYHVGIDDPDSWSVPTQQGKKPRQGPAGQALNRKRADEYRAKNQKPPQKGEGAVHYAGPAFDAPDCADDDLLDGDMTRLAAERLRELAKSPGKPFFLGVGYHNPHVPWVAPKKYWDLYDPAKLPMADNQYAPKDAPKFAAASGADFYWYGNVPKDRQLSEEFKRQCLHGYLAAISYVDAQIGWLMKTLEETGLDKNTIVVFWGDHGYYMGEHGWWGGKHNNYEGATRAPLIVSVPAIKTAGQKTHALVDFVDIYPTLSELAGLPKVEAGVEGLSFVPVLKDPQRAWKKAAFSQYPKGGNLGTSMRTDRYRYVEWVNKAGDVVARELYDHQTDPQENQNLAGRADAKVLEDLAVQMKAGPRGARP